MTRNEHGRWTITHRDGSVTETDDADLIESSAAQEMGRALRDADDAAAAKGALPIGRVYRVTTAAEALAVRAVLRPGDVVVRGTQLALIAGPQSDTVDGGIRQDEVTR